MTRDFGLAEPDYKYLCENASDAIWVHDREGNFLYANAAFERLSGYTSAEWVNMNIADFLDQESMALAREVSDKLLHGENLEQPYGQKLITKSGQPRILRMSANPVVIDGEVRGFQHIARDITERRRGLQTLARITNGSPVATFVINDQHEITHWNLAIASLTGISEKEMVGTDMQWRAFYAEKRPTMADLIVDGASPEQIDSYYHGKYEKSRLIDGAYEAQDFFRDLSKHGKWLHFTASPIRGEDGEIIGAIETLQDINEEKRLQESMHYYVQVITEAQEEERKRIARELHDDVSPPLLLLIQRLDAITSGPRPKLFGLQERLEDLRSQAVTALENVRRCAQDLRPRIIDDLGLVAALEWIAEDMVRNHGIDTRVDVVGNEHDIDGDVQVLLFRIAQEALYNVRRHAQATSARVTLEFVDHSVQLVITDNGRGFYVPERMQDLANAGRLGIMGMIERARLLRGTLKVESARSQGTRVVAEIPLPSV